jgi:hypothetical protein
VSHNSFPHDAKQLGDLSYLPKSSIRLRYASKAEIQTNSYKNHVKSDDFTGFLVRPTRFERATYRVGVFRRSLIKCHVFKALQVFTEFAEKIRTSRKALKTLGKTAFSDLRTVVVKQ